jgi:phosphoribosylanthranilate isomerase
MIGLFVNAAPEHMLAAIRQCGLDAIQLSGDEASEVACHLPGIALFKAIRLDGAPSEAGWLDANQALDVRLLVDAHVPGSYGGAGVLADWNRAAELARRRSIILAGGLTPENVDAAIRQVHPWGVDVSSGVETNGVKDAAKIRAFVAAARAGDQQLASEQTQAR